MATTKTIREIWTALNLAYPYYAKERDSKEILQTLHLYERMLGDIDDGVLKDAAATHIANSKYFPTIAELRGAAVAMVIQPARELALEAWGTVLSAAHQEWPGRYTYYEFTVHDGPGLGETSGTIREEDVKSEPTFANPLTQQVVRMLGGWRAIMASDCQAAERARFVQAYDELAERERQMGQMLPEIRARMTANRATGLVGQVVRQLTGKTQEAVG